MQSLEAYNFAKKEAIEMRIFLFKLYEFRLVFYTNDKVKKYTKIKKIAHARITLRKKKDEKLFFFYLA